MEITFERDGTVSLDYDNRTGGIHGAAVTALPSAKTCVGWVSTHRCSNPSLFTPKPHMAV